MNREELDEILDGRRLVVSVSGGKDSTACCLYLMEMGYAPEEFDRIFFDTGWEHPLLYEYINEDLPKVVGPIKTLHATVELTPELEEVAEAIESELGVEYSAMVRICLRKGIFPSRQTRWCTTELKVKPAKAYHDAVEQGVVSVVGIIAQESKARALMTEWEFSPAFDCDTWRPLIDWPVEKVIEIHQRNGVRPCRLYLEQNADRVGCYPCIYSRKSEIKSLGDFAPERIDTIERLELAVTEAAKKIVGARGETLDKLRTFFLNKRPKFVEETGKWEGDGWPIRRVIEWGKTTRGGSVDQMELFTDPHGHQGCVRWGMCDTGTQ